MSPYDYSFAGVTAANFKLMKSENMDAMSRSKRAHEPMAAPNMTIMASILAGRASSADGEGVSTRYFSARFCAGA